ncbi:MAG TPA: rhodanese-like domain-containing protein [Burkholderiaceae bacterium]|nr:rhodanese-like domain-containing protein [Burkholderiaceae bacterium]
MLKYLLDNWFLVLAAVVSGAGLLWISLGPRAARGGVSTQEAVQLINRQKAVLIDVSEPGEYAVGHAVGARNIPLASLESAKNLPSNKSLPLLVLCATGGRASRAVGVLKKMGFENAHAVAGGLNAWRAANLPVEKSA